mmetsp:Transcript_20369/g.24457  ORF Transcript_20369/g.24457 Transcript_20369/m.24457 type:complete len:252 (-) Transcript_20369:2917-3672(-)
MSLCIELDDCLHDFRIIVPVQRLQIVGCHDVNLFLAAHTSKENNLLGIPRLKQHLHSLHLVSGLCIFLTSQMIRSLTFAALPNSPQQICPLLRCPLILWRSHCFCHVFTDQDVVLHRQPKCLLKVLRAHQQMHCFPKLPMLKEEVRAPAKKRGICVVSEIICNCPQTLKQLSSEANVKSLAHITPFLVQQHRLLKHLLPFKVLSSVHHRVLIRLQRQVHQLVVHPVLLRKTECMTEAMRAAEELNRLWDLV